MNDWQPIPSYAQRIQNQTVMPVVVSYLYSLEQTNYTATENAEQLFDSTILVYTYA